MEKRTEWQKQSKSQIGEEKGSGRLVGAAETSRACGMEQTSAEKLEQTGPAEKSGLSATGRTVGKYTRATLAKRNGTKPSVQSTRS